MAAGGAAEETKTRARLCQPAPHPSSSLISLSILISPAPVHPVQFATWLKRKLVIEPALAAVRKQRAEHRPDTSLGQEKWMQ